MYSLDVLNHVPPVLGEVNATPMAPQPSSPYIRAMSTN